MMGILFDQDVEWKNYHKDISLNISNVNVFKSSVDNVYDRITSLYRDILSEKELTKANRYVDMEDKKRFIVGKYMLRDILSKFTSIPPSLIQFQQSYNKKPAIKEGIEFNIAHSHNIVLIAISQYPLGIDIEFVNKDFDYQTLLPFVCNDLELSLINSALNKLICFYSVWTRKEAILKATGEGLLDELRELNCLKDIIYRNQSKYYVSSLIVENDYVASLAYSSPTEISFWRH